MSAFNFISIPGRVFMQHLEERKLREKSSTSNQHRLLANLEIWGSLRANIKVSTEDASIKLSIFIIIRSLTLYPLQQRHIIIIYESQADESFNVKEKRFVVVWSLWCVSTHLHSANLFQSSKFLSTPSPWSNLYLITFFLLFNFTFYRHESLLWRLM